MKPHIFNGRSVPKLALGLPLALAGLVWLATAFGVGAGEIRPDHPRIFITREMIPALKERCRGTHQDFFDRMKARCDQGEAKAIQQALCYVVTGDRRYADAAKAGVRKDSEQRPGEESIALDWIYDTLSKQEMAEFGAMLLGKSRKSLWDPDHDHSRCNFRDLVWWNQHYAYTFGETFMKDLFLSGEGVDDAAVATSLRDKVKCLKECFIWGHNLTGGNPEGFNYWNGMVEPQCDWPVEAWRTATGEDLFQDSVFHRQRGAWYLYARYPASGAAVGINDGHGLAPGSPKWTVLPLLGSHAGDRVCQWMANEYVANPKSHYGYGDQFWCAILWYDPTAAATKPEALPPCSLFEGLGWVSMRSSWQRDATFCYFMAGDWFNGHRHQDCGSLIIASRGGYLAVDSGYYSTYQDDRQSHGIKYTTRGIAHNILFVHDPHERSGGMWDKTLRVRDDGGVLLPGNRGRRESEQPIQGSPWDSADITAYEANPLFTYVAADLTGNYRRELDPFMNPKGPAIIEHYTRELLYLAPDIILIHDRVKSTDPRYTKRVLLHVIAEPEVRAKPIRAPALGIAEFEGAGDAVVTDGAGRMFVRALLPEKRIVRRIGGVAVKSVTAAPANKGNGQLKQIKTLLGACTETIEAKCVQGGPAAKFDVTSSVFGKIGIVEVGKPFTDDPRHPEYKSLKLDPHVSFVIEPGSKPFEPGDTFNLELVSRRFWVSGENPEPSLKWWTHLGHAEATLDSRRMGGWGRLEIEPAEPTAENHFLTVLYCTDSAAEAMPGNCELIRELGVAAVNGVRLTQGDRAYEVRFSAAGKPGGRIRVTAQEKVLVDRLLARSVERNYRGATAAWPRLQSPIPDEGLFDGPESRQIDTNIR